MRLLRGERRLPVQGQRFRIAPGIGGHLRPIAQGITQATLIAQSLGLFACADEQFLGLLTFWRGWRQFPQQLSQHQQAENLIVRRRQRLRCRQCGAQQGLRFADLANPQRGAGGVDLNSDPQGGVIAGSDCSQGLPIKTLRCPIIADAGGAVAQSIQRRDRDPGIIGALGAGDGLLQRLLRCIRFAAQPFGLTQRRQRFRL